MESMNLEDLQQEVERYERSLSEMSSEAGKAAAQRKLDEAKRNLQRALEDQRETE
jgi:ElaB/YqjD/DUF883 family membrane-anchored ribosome-binding protein